MPSDIDNNDNINLRLVSPDEVVHGRRRKKAGSGTSVDSEELRRFAQMTIDERIKFCKEKKDKYPDTDIDKCACEAIERWIRLFKDVPMNGSKALGRARVDAVRRLFDEMKKKGTIKCDK